MAELKIKFTCTSCQRDFVVETPYKLRGGKNVCARCYEDSIRQFTRDLSGNQLGAASSTSHSQLKQPGSRALRGRCRNCGKMFKMSFLNRFGSCGSCE